MVTLFGIKNCDTVKKARRWLETENIEYQFHDFRIDGISAEQVATWLDATSLATLINKRSTTWKALSDTDKDNINVDNAVPLILEHPTLIKRPLLAIGTEVHLGFNDKTYHTLFK
jgi:arsenate reductase